MDDLWDDSDGNDKPSLSKTRKPSSKSRKKSTIATTTITSSSSSSPSPSPPTTQIDEDALYPDIPNFEDLALGPVGELERLPLSPDNPYSVPASINRYLRAYQQEGVQFIGRRLTQTPALGTILGDDMGLGKTIQSIAVFAALFNKTGTYRDEMLLKERQKYIEENAMRQRKREMQVRGVSGWQIKHYTRLTVPPYSLLFKLLASHFARRTIQNFTQLFVAALP